MIKEIRHVGVVVKNINLMSKFYQNVLGMKIKIEYDEEGEYIDKILGKEKISIHIIKLENPDGPIMELLKFRSEEDKIKIQKKSLAYMGITHIAFTVDDIDDVHSKIINSGCEIISPPLESPDAKAKVFFARDPEGNYIEMVQLLKK